MKSPFPGMDPYLERQWRDVHHRLVTHTVEVINESLPSDLAARSEDRVYVDYEGMPTRVIGPDVRVVELPERTGAWRESQSAVATDEPMVLELEFEPLAEPYIEIIEMNGGKVITVIEFISPTNKLEGYGKSAYLKKREEYICSNANLVEIDLVRAGDWVSMLQPYHVPKPYRSTYRVSVVRAIRRDKAEFYGISLRQRLPAFRVPLRPSDKDVALDLQPLLDRVYVTGRYDGSIDYRKPCEPPLDASDAAWVDELLKLAGR